MYILHLRITEYAERRTFVLVHIVIVNTLYRLGLGLRLGNISHKWACYYMREGERERERERGRERGREREREGGRGREREGERERGRERCRETEREREREREGVRERQAGGNHYVCEEGIPLTKTVSHSSHRGASMCQAQLPRLDLD